VYQKPINRSATLLGFVNSLIFAAVDIEDIWNNYFCEFYERLVMLANRLILYKIN
jgi:hypothetical protein